MHEQRSSRDYHESDDLNPVLSPRKIQASNAIWIRIVLLMTLDSVAESERKEWFNSVNATAVFTTASQTTIPQLSKLSLGNP